MPLIAVLIAVALLCVGYAIGRYRPAHRMSDWAHWQTYGKQQERRTARWWTVWAVLSVETLALLLLHPVRTRHAWKHRNDPPPPHSPALQFDPDWAAKRRSAAEGTNQ